MLDDDSPWPADAIEVGYVAGAWGLKGLIRVQPLARDPQALFSSKRWFLQPALPRGPLAAPVVPPLLRVITAREHGGAIVAGVQEAPDRSAAERLKGARVFVPRSSFPTAEVGEYYWVDLLGLAVYNRQGEALGVVADLLDTGAHSVLRLTAPAVDADSGPVERLIPFVAAYIDDVNLPAKRITVDWGLDY